METTVVRELVPAYKKTRTKLKTEERLTKSDIAYNLLIKLMPNLSYKESFYALLLNRRNDLVGYSHISTGGVSGTVVDPKIVFQAALLANASALIVAHNHPSGNTSPSEADRALTIKLKGGAKLLDIRLLDHIIVCEDGYYSFADNGEI